MAARGPEQAGMDSHRPARPGFGAWRRFCRAVLYSALTEDDPDPPRPARAAGQGP